ncbi:MAG: DNA topoisomerase (ATP-hydrolyzing) subunit A [Eubacteriales bacterium]|nr:DNA topoisomerase (ATP-hydrolyzing) subunit A [Eubacteriales bacterium]
MSNEKDVKAIEKKISDTLFDNFMPYAMSVILSRAIPEIDGFKPAHRKLLYTMYKMNLQNGPRAKSADIVGQTMKLNPHGDQTIYETMVRLTRGNGTLLHPWVDSKGNFGSVSSRDMQYAASRYTEARLDPLCETIFSGLEKNAVDFVDNYSGTMQEPLLFPVTFPTILVNNNQGIAVGMASNICSFNLREICDTTIALIKDPKADLLETLPAPDFSTAAYLIYKPDEMRDIYETGRGSFQLRATADVNRKDRRIEIREIPYTTTIEAIIDDIADGIKKGKLRDIVSVRDETDLSGLCVSVDYKASADPDVILHQLFTSTSLQSAFSCNFNILVDNRPRVMGVRDILLEWVDWRGECIKREALFDAEKKGKNLHLLRGLERILLDIDKAIAVIRLTETEEEVLPRLMSAFDIDETQADYVAEIKLRHLNRAYILKRVRDIETLEKEIADLEQLAKSKAKIRDKIVRQLKEIAKKYGRERKTRLIAPEEIEIPEEEELIPAYNTRVYLSEEGYMKKLAATSLRGNFEIRFKEGDRLLQEMDSTNHSELLFFTNKAQVYKMMAWEIEDHRPSQLGEYTPNLLELDEDEHVVFMHSALEPFTGEFMFVFENGKGVRIDASHYETVQRRKKLINAYDDSSPLIGMAYLAPESDLSFAVRSKKNKLLYFDASLIVKKATRTARGATILRSKNDYLTKLYAEDELDFIRDVNYYRIAKLPTAGRYIREETLEDRQLELEESTE